MRIIMIVTLCGLGAFGKQQDSTGVPDVSIEDIAAIKQRYSQQVQCVKRLDTVLHEKWFNEVLAVNTDDAIRSDPKAHLRKKPAKMYDFSWQEWLMEQGSTSRSMDSCVRGLVSEILPTLNQEDINCLNEVFAWHIEKEIEHEDELKKYLQKISYEQLPFRKFLSFNELVDLLFENRSIEKLDADLRELYTEAESYAPKKQDKVDRRYTIEQICEWRNAKALHEALDEDAMYEEFVRQVKDSADQQLGHQVVLNWNLELSLSEKKLTNWKETRGRMMQLIDEKVAKLRAEKKDAQSLCEYATMLAYELSGREARLLVRPGSIKINLKIEEVRFHTAHSISSMRETHDFRLPLLKSLFDKYDNGTLCLTAFMHLIENHHRLNMALLFINESYNYPEFFCNFKGLNLGLVNPRFCKCVSSFCVARDLGSLFAEIYNLEQGTNGTYGVTLSSPASGVNYRRYFYNQ